MSGDGTGERVPVAFVEADDLLLGDMPNVGGQWLVLQARGGASVGIEMTDSLRRGLVRVLSEDIDAAADGATVGTPRMLH